MLQLSSSLRKHKKTVHGPDSHVLGGKKPRHSGKDGDSFEAGRLKSTMSVLKQEKMKTGKSWANLDLSASKRLRIRHNPAHITRWKYQLRAGLNLP